MSGTAFTAGTAPSRKTLSTGNMVKRREGSGNEEERREQQAESLVALVLACRDKGSAKEMLGSIVAKFKNNGDWRAFVKKLREKIMEGFRGLRDLRNRLNDILCLNHPQQIPEGLEVHFRKGKKSSGAKKRALLYVAWNYLVELCEQYREGWMKLA